MSKQRILLLCGGQSEEHDVSLASAASVLAVLGENYDVLPLVIDKSGALLDENSSRTLLSSSPEGKAKSSSLNIIYVLKRFINHCAKFQDSNFGRTRNMTF